MSNKPDSPLVLQLPHSNPLRRVSSVNIPLLLFVAFATNETDPHRTIQPEWNERLCEAIKRAAQEGATERREVLGWLNASLEYARQGCEILLADLSDVHVDRDLVERIYNRAERDTRPHPCATTAQEDSAAEHFRTAPRHFTRSITDPLVFTLEWIRLAKSVGSRSKLPDVCDDCAYIDAMLGDLDPACPLCEVERRPLPLVSSDPAKLIISILKTCERGATLMNSPHS